MKTRSLIIILALQAIVIQAGCTPASPAIPSQTSTPSGQSLLSSGDAISLVKAYMDTANTGDFNKTLAFYADDAVVYNPLGVFVGKDEISKWLENDVKTTRAKPADIQIQANLVTVTGTVSLDRFKKAGVGDVAFRAEYIVQNGKIRFFAPTVKLTPDQQSKMKAAQANAPAAPTQQIAPVDVAKAYVEAANSGDFEKALSFYADDAAALVMNGTLLLSGKDQIAGWLKNDVQTTRANPETWQANGNVVNNTGLVSLARFEQIGIKQVQFQSLYVIENGKIRFFRPTAILTPDQQAMVKAVQPSPTKAP